MEKVIRDNRGYPLGWTNTPDKKGTFNEFCDGAGNTYRGTISDTLKSIDWDELKRVKAKGELF